MSPWNFTTQAGGSDGYDAEDRFMNFVQPARNRNVSFTRSDIGNIADIDINGNVKSRRYSDVHALLSTTTIIGGRTYDDDGNLVGNILQSYVWDAAGRLKRANVLLGSISEYGYDSQNKRRWRKVNRGTTYSPDDPPAGVETVYIYAGANCVAEYPRGAPADSPSQEYVYAPGIDSLVLKQV